MNEVIYSHDHVSFKDASDKQAWLDVMHVKYDALMKNRTWKCVALQPDENSIDYNSIYITKFKVNDAIQKLKTRLVMKG